MRPRHTAAENRLGRPGRCTPGVGFNEAAAYSRGKRRRSAGQKITVICFNEATAYSRGKQEYIDESRRVYQSLQ